MYGYDYENVEDTQIRHSIIQNHKKLLSKIANAGVVALLCDNPNGFFLLECCDGYYYFELNQKDCLELAEMFRELAEIV